MGSEVVVMFNEFAKAGAESGVRGAIVATMERLRANAVELAPADTGRLRNSIMWRKGWPSDVFNLPGEGGFNEAGGAPADKRIGQPRGEYGLVGTATNYGVYQELGTRYMPAQPYMRPAGDAVRGANASEIARKWGNDAMDREFRRRKERRGSA